MPVRECPRCKSKLDEISAEPPLICRLCLARYRLALPVVPLACTVRLRLGRFGRESLTARAAAEHVSPDEVVSRAAAYFVSGVQQRRPARRLPRGLPESNAQAVELEVALSEREWASLESEARRRGVALERLLEHALLLYLADVTSGRVAQAVLRRSDEDADTRAARTLIRGLHGRGDGRGIERAQRFL